MQRNSFCRTRRNIRGIISNTVACRRSTSVTQTTWFVKPKQISNSYAISKYSFLRNIRSRRRRDFFLFNAFLFRAVEDEILMILRSRFEQCSFYHGEADRQDMCADLRKIYDEAALNWFIKCEYIHVHVTVDCKNNGDKFGFWSLQIASCKWPKILLRLLFFQSNPIDGSNDESKNLIWRNL